MGANDNDNKRNRIERRSFVKAISLSSVGAAIFGANRMVVKGGDNKNSPNHSPSVKKKVLMKVGCQTGGTSKENLEFKARHGVFNIDGGSPKYIPGVGWDLADSMAKKEA